MKGDRRKVYMVTAFTSSENLNMSWQTFQFASNAEGWDLAKEINGRARTVLNLRKKPERGVVIQTVFCTGYHTRGRKKCSK